MLRPSETIELYLYFFILTYLIVFSRRIREIETQEGKRGRAASEVGARRG